MVVKARDDVTVATLNDVAMVLPYYLTQSNTASAPATPTTNPPTGSWTNAEPTYNSSNTVYMSFLTVFSDGSFDWSTPTKSSNYEAAKAAYNKATSAYDTANNAQESANQALANAQELIRNPNMDASKAVQDGWYAGVIQSSTEAPDNPPYPLSTYAKLVSRDHQPSWAIPNYTVGRTYQFSCYARADNNTTCNFAFGLHLNGGNNNNWRSAFRVTPDQGKTGWAKYTGTITIPSGSLYNNAYPWLQIDKDGSQTSTNWWYVTGLSIKDITEVDKAQKDATNAQKSADSKTTNYYQPTKPTGGTYKKGDTWFDTDDGNHIYTHDGSSWIDTQLGTNAIKDAAITNAKVSNLDVGKLTSGEASINDAVIARIASQMVESEKFQTTSGDTGFDDARGLYSKRSFKEIASYTEGFESGHNGTPHYFVFSRHTNTGTSLNIQGNVVSTGLWAAGPVTLATGMQLVSQNLTLAASYPKGGLAFQISLDIKPYAFNIGLYTWTAIGLVTYHDNTTNVDRVSKFSVDIMDKRLSNEWQTITLYSSEIFDTDITISNVCIYFDKTGTGGYPELYVDNVKIAVINAYSSLRINSSKHEPSIEYSRLDHNPSSTSETDGSIYTKVFPFPVYDDPGLLPFPGLYDGQIVKVVGEGFQYWDGTRYRWSPLATIADVDNIGSLSGRTEYESLRNPNSSVSQFGHSFIADSYSGLSSIQYRFGSILSVGDIGIVGRNTYRYDGSQWVTDYYDNNLFSWYSTWGGTPANSLFTEATKTFYIQTSPYGYVLALAELGCRFNGTGEYGMRIDINNALDNSLVARWGMTTPQKNGGTINYTQSHTLKLFTDIKYKLTLTTFMWGSGTIVNTDSSGNSSLFVDPEMADGNGVSVPHARYAKLTVIK